MEDSDNFGKSKGSQIKVTLWSNILGIRKSLPVVLGLENTYGRDNNNEVIRHGSKESRVEMQIFNSSW